MEQSVVIRYINGTKSSAVENIPIAGRSELTVGRGSACDVGYDVAGDDLVSRRHMKIEISGTETPEFTAIDLGSRNGTFINKQRIKEPTRLQAGDVVQLGSGGPEFVFDLDPRNPEPPDAAYATAYNVLSDLAGHKGEAAQPLPHDRPIIVARPSKPSGIPVAAPPIPVAIPPTPVQSLGKRRMAVGAIFVGLALAVPAWQFISPGRARFSSATKSGLSEAFDPSRTRPDSTVEPARSFSTSSPRVSQKSKSELEVAERKPPIQAPAVAANADSVVHVETAWMLIDRRTGRQLRQVYIENSTTDAKDGTLSPLIPIAGRRLPLFVLLESRRLQPVLTLSENASYRPIGGVYTDAGFLAAKGGLVLTSRRVAAPWTVPYDWPPDAVAGVVANFDKKLRPISTAALARRQFPQWRPLDSQFVLTGSPDAPTLRLSAEEMKINGRADYLTVSFRKESRRVSAKVVRSSKRSDLAALRIDPGPSTAAQLREGADCKPGEAALIPNVSDGSPEWKGHVVALLREKDASSGSVQRSGDRYELAGRAPSDAAPGTPIFDAKGQVFAIEVAGDPLRPEGVVGVPIRYGLELLPGSNPLLSMRAVPR